MVLVSLNNVHVHFGYKKAEDVYTHGKHKVHLSNVEIAISNKTKHVPHKDNHLTLLIMIKSHMRILGTA